MEPTSDMVRRIWAPKFQDFLDSFGIPYTPRVAPYVSHTLHFPGGDSTILGLSFENYQRIVGDDWAFAIIDEVDTAKASIAQRAYDKIWAVSGSGTLISSIAIQRQRASGSTIKRLALMQHGKASAERCSG